MKYDVKITGREMRYDGFFHLEALDLQHTQFAGGWGEPIRRELIQKGNAAAAILYDPDLDSVVMVEQFRIGAYMANVENRKMPVSDAWTLGELKTAISQSVSP